MRLKLILGLNKSITLQHLEEELYQVVEEERCHVEAKVEDMVMMTNVGWVIYKDKYCSLPRYRIPSQAVKDIQFLQFPDSVTQPLGINGPRFEDIDPDFWGIRIAKTMLGLTEVGEEE